MNAVVSSPSRHPALRPGWSQPEVPAGYDRLVLCEYGFSRELDFLNDAADVFAADEAGHTLGLPWPWVPDFAPTDADWKAIGILVVNFCEPRG